MPAPSVPDPAVPGPGAHRSPRKPPRTAALLAGPTPRLGPRPAAVNLHREPAGPRKQPPPQQLRRHHATGVTFALSLPFAIRPRTRSTNSLAALHPTLPLPLLRPTTTPTTTSTTTPAPGAAPGAATNHLPTSANTNPMGRRIRRALRSLAAPAPRRSAPPATVRPAAVGRRKQQHLLGLLGGGAEYPCP